MIKINKGYWRAAGNIFKWVKDGHHVFGVGIDISYMHTTHPEILLEVENQEFSLNVAEWKEFSRHYNAYKSIGKTKLAIVSKSLLKPLKRDSGASQGQPKASLNERVDTAIENLFSGTEQA